MEIRDSGKGFLFACNPVHHASWWTFEDEQSVRDAFWKPGEGDVILDVGCAFGSYLLPALAAGAAKAYAWNPLESELSMMKASLEANGWEERVEIFQTALHASAGFVNPDTAEFRTEEFPGAFPTETLDSYLDKIMSAGKYWMKMDVEGAEVDVLRGASRLIEALKPTVVVECHEFRRAGITGEVEAVLKGHGYRMEACVPYHAVQHALLVP